MVDIVEKVFRWFWTFSWVIMFISSNSCIMFSFTNITWTTRTISFTSCTWFIIVSIFLKNKDYVFIVFSAIASLKPSLTNFQNFFKKSFDLILLTTQQGLLVDMKGLVIPNKCDEVILYSFPWSEPYWSSLFILLIKRNG